MMMAEIYIRRRQIENQGKVENGHMHLWRRVDESKMKVHPTNLENLEMTETKMPGGQRYFEAMKYWMMGMK